MSLAQTSDASTTTTVTGVTGTVTQLNYGNGGSVEGFLIGTNTLLLFPMGICGGVSTLGVVGNSVTYSGSEITSTSGFSSVVVTSFTNNTTKATYTAPTSATTSTSTTYGPTSGTVKQLNYANDGSIDGFLFTAGGATLFVSTGTQASATLATLLTVNGAVSVTGKEGAGANSCASTSSLTEVNATSLTVGATTVVISGGGAGNGRGGPGGGGPHN
jgi:hypothetical protein